MAPSPTYYVWIGSGKPYVLMRPAKVLQAALRGHGLTVYDYPNDAHLRANTPEDHTPFSATGWPGKSAYGVGHALDVMPRADTAAARAENAAIARQLIRDRNAAVAGTLWIKYINWTDEQGACHQERWMPSHETRSSTDKGHIHISGRSDADNDARAEGYDPIARMTAAVQGGPVELSSILPAPKAGTNVGDALAGTWKTAERIADGPNAAQPVAAHVWLAAQLGEIKAAVAAGGVDAAAVAALLAGNQSFIGAIAVAVAEELNDPAAMKQAAKDGSIAAAKVIADAVAQIP